MKKILRGNASRLTGIIQVPGDKSISHRAVLFGAIANGKTTISNFLFGEDCLRTIECMEKLGVVIERDVQHKKVVVYGTGINGLIEPKEILYTGNSGTTTRLLLGLLSATNFYSVIVGDESIQRRPMDRVVIPLKKMGALIDGRQNGSYTPISVRGTNLQSITYELPVASAQVKSALLLAGLFGDGITLRGKIHTRDHTEQMLSSFGVDVRMSEEEIVLKGGQSLKATTIDVPGDFSSAALFIVMALIVPNSKIVIKNVGLNKTRTGLLDVIQSMGGQVELKNVSQVNGETRGTIIVQYSSLKATTIDGAIIPRLIDEIPIIALLATQAAGTTWIRNASELKVKESNRIKTVVQQLQKLGANIEELEDGMKIIGKTTLKGGCTVSACGDHRIGMMLAAASLICENDIELEDEQCISISYPNFFQDLNQLVEY